MLNKIWFWMVVSSLLIAAGTDIKHEFFDPLPQKAQQSGTKETLSKTTPLGQVIWNLFSPGAPATPALSKTTALGRVTTAAINAADVGVNIAIGLIGVMALWLGIMKIAEASGMIAILARLVSPVTKRLFPTIPTDHPAIGAMLMNIAANMLGLSNAATPLGLKAMDELQELNEDKDTASNDMITFLVINTSAITLIPATAIAIRASLGSANPQQIIVPSIIAATVATIVGLSTVKTIQYFEKKKSKGKEKIDGAV